jgi:hypothetical protein
MTNTAPERTIKMAKNLVVARRALVIFAALVAATAVAACGSSSSSSSGASSSSSAGKAAASTPSANRSTLAACLKKHGVTLPARGPGGGGPPGGAPGGGGPPGGGGGGFLGGGGGNPKFRAAFQACGGRRPAGSTSNASFRAAIVKYVTCVRQHGYQLPNPNFTGKGSVFSSKIRSDPKFMSASKACQSLLAGPRPAAPSGA